MRVFMTERDIEIKQKSELKNADYVTGIFIGNEKGFGFVEVEGMEEDFFISKSDVNGAMHHDTVMVQVYPGRSGKRKEAKVVKILAHEIREVVGYFQKNKGFGYVLPDNKKINYDIFVSKKDMYGAVNGHKVVVKIKKYSKNGKKPEGFIKEILGHTNDPGVDIMSVVKSYGIESKFPHKVMEQVEKIPDSISEADIEGRSDLRNIDMVTIDGADAKDLDDAVSLDFDGKFYTLGVHIADVTHYVRENSPLDKEALKRSTSVYLVDRVIPMLPHKLSNGLCSLNQLEDRLALSCIMKVDKKGEIVDHYITKSVINVNRRMTYDEVNGIINNDSSLREKHEDLVPLFDRMYELSRKLRANRNRRGSIGFETKECKIILDKMGHPTEIKPYDRNDATLIIEDFMLAANETVAEDFYWRQAPFVYRNHAEPDIEKIKELRTFVRSFGHLIKFSNNKIYPTEIQKLLEDIKGKPEESLISRMALRSMQRAEYSPECRGHFGLAAKYYCHFTSPIRRYPDLQIHRIIKEALTGGLDDNRASHYNKILGEVTKDCSENERRAEDAERETDKIKKAEYMMRYIGEEFSGIVSGVTNYGIYVELENTVEGMVHVSTMMDDHYNFHEDSYSMVGEKTGKVYSLGQKVNVIVENANKVSKNIDFILAD